jgi:hypothetical protein
MATHFTTGLSKSFTTCSSSSISVAITGTLLLCHGHPRSWQAPKATQPITTGMTDEHLWRQMHVLIASKEFQQLG